MRTNPAREGDEMETTGAAARHANPELAQRFLRDVMPLHHQVHLTARRMTRNSSDAEALVWLGEVLAEMRDGFGHLAALGGTPSPLTGQ